MSDARFLIPGDLMTPTGGYAYDRQILDHLKRRDFPLVHLPLGGNWPFPDGHALSACAKLFGALSERTALLIDGLAFGAMPEALLRQARGPLIALCHHPLALETGLDETMRHALRASEMRAFDHATAVIVTSAATAHLLEREFGVRKHKLRIAVPGTKIMSRAMGGGSPPQIVAVGSVCVRKNYDGLLTSLRHVADLPWRLTIAGRIEDADLMDILSGTISTSGWTDRIRFTGPITDEEVEQLLGAADIFVMPSHYEGYGMALMEAVASGLPCVTTDAVPSARQVPAGGLAIVPAGDSAAFGSAIRELLADMKARKILGNLAWQARNTLPNWEDAAEIIANTLREALR